MMVLYCMSMAMKLDFTEGNYCDMLVCEEYSYAIKS